jgi:Rho-binding antiterminator
MLQNSEPRNLHVVKGPTPDPSQLKDSYEPVACDFTDELENLAVRRAPVDVAYWDESGQPQTVSGVIVDIFTSPEKEEFVKLNEGEFIRLDKISEVRPRPAQYVTANGHALRVGNG